MLLSKEINAEFLLGITRYGFFGKNIMVEIRVGKQ